MIRPHCTKPECQATTSGCICPAPAFGPAIVLAKIAAQDADEDDIVQQAKGRAKFLRERGEVKTPALLDRLAAEIEWLRVDPKETK